MKENIDSLERAVEDRDEKEIARAKNQIVKVNQEIKENIRKLKSYSK
jgi:hypothetical protein